jgi:hypothetical protein
MKDDTRAQAKESLMKTISNLIDEGETNLKLEVYETSFDLEYGYGDSFKWITITFDKEGD